MPRSLAELSYVDPDIEFIAYPVVNSDLKSRNWFTDPNAMRVMLAEYAKVLLAGARNITGFGRHHRAALGRRHPASELDFYVRASSDAFYDGPLSCRPARRLRRYWPRESFMIALRSVLFNTIFDANVIIRNDRALALLFRGAAQDRLCDPQELGALRTTG